MYTIECKRIVSLILNVIRWSVLFSLTFSECSIQVCLSIYNNNKNTYAVHLNRCLMHSSKNVNSTSRIYTYPTPTIAHIILSFCAQLTKYSNGTKNAWSNNTHTHTHIWLDLKIIFCFVSVSISTAFHFISFYTLSLLLNMHTHTNTIFSVRIRLALEIIYDTVFIFAFFFLL